MGPGGDARLFNAVDGRFGACPHRTFGSDTVATERSGATNGGAERSGGAQRGSEVQGRREERSDGKA